MRYIASLGGFSLFLPGGALLLSHFLLQFLAVGKASEKTRATTKAWESKTRQEGLEVPKTIWLRKDVYVAMEMFLREYKEKYGKRLTMKQLVNEALFDLILRRKQELIHGQPVPFEDTTYDKDTGETKRKSI